MTMKIAERDERTYAHYVKWCQGIGITPLDFSSWQRHSEAHTFVEQIAHVLSDPRDREPGFQVVRRP